MNQKKINIELEIILRILKSPLHGRQLSKELGVPLTTIQRFLSIMESKNVIDFELIGRNKVYFIKKNLFAREYVYNAENYKLLKLIEKYRHLEPIITGILKESQHIMVVLFGSYAKFIAKDDSDIDVYVETSAAQLKEKIEMINTKLSVKIGKFDTNSILVKEIIKNHVILRGVESFYDKIKFFE